ncbi:MAG TPA: Uma2 family endonuclease [Tepidisphaeraceae bacterium]|nr:Uma2 family endonuclease [Tepidisphaeraceae bacterium]
MPVTFSDGSIEIMPPLPLHETPRRAIGVLIDVLTLECCIPASCDGSTTFRREDRQKGLEPDECYYFENAGRVLGMTEYDPAIYPAPDLAIEIDIIRRSIPRQPIYAGLGVPELWRYDGRNLAVLLLSSSAAYIPSTTSWALPFWPMNVFESFVHRMQTEMRTDVLREVQTWVRSLPR